MNIGLRFDEDAHRYELDGVQVPGVTEVLRGGGLISLADWRDQEAALMVDLGFARTSLVPSEVLANAQARGKRVHKCCHYLADHDLDWDTVDDKDRSYVEAAAQFLDDSKFELLRDRDGRPVGREIRVYSRRYKYAGTADLLGRWHNTWALVDYKTGDPEDVAAGLQLAGYENALREMPEIVALLGLKASDTILRCSVKLASNGKYTPTPYDKPKHARDFSYFLAALALHHYRANKAA